MNKFIYNTCGKILSKLTKGREEFVPYEQSKYAKKLSVPGTAKPDNDTAYSDVTVDKNNKKTAKLDESPIPSAADVEDTNSTDGEEDIFFEPTAGAPKAEKNWRRLIKPIAIAAGVVISALVIANIIRGLPEKEIVIPLQNSIVVEFSGYNGTGTAAAKISHDKLFTLLRDASTQNKKSSALYSKENIENAVSAAIVATSVSLDANDDLSNGDIIVATVVFDEAKYAAIMDTQEVKLPYVFTIGTATMTVAELEEGTPLDVFAESAIELRVEGISGIAESYLDVKLSGLPAYYLSYDWQPKTNISNGDVITVSIRPDTEKLSELGYAIPKTTERQYPVSGLPEYVSDATDIPDALVSSMVSRAETRLNKTFASVEYDNTNALVVSPMITSAYFLDNANKNQPYSDWWTGLKMNNAVAVVGFFSISELAENEERAPLLQEPPATEDVDGQDTASEDVPGDALEQPDAVADTIATPAAENTPAADAAAGETANTYGGYYVWFYPDVVKNANGTVTYESTLTTEKATAYQSEQELVNWLKSEFEGFAVSKMGTNPGE